MVGVGKYPPTPRGGLKREFLEHPLRYSTKNVDLTPCSTFFLEPESLELDAFGCEIFRVGGVEQFFVEWSAPKHPLRDLLLS
uniref:Uncharacterized protein n=1 Tax=Setaria viridis TaxID=4556 RepID=A0A4U6T1L0_SETVI|nr:hypothetical protein SEVIR_9G303633v2 [Setaria viridis]